jgi:hypothetical protein
VYCSNCGTKAEGRYCFNCGSPLINDLPSDFDWTGTLDYSTLRRVQAVRDRIAQCADGARAKLSAEKFIEYCDTALKPLIGIPIPLKPITELVTPLVLPIYSRLGINVEKAQVRDFRIAPGVALVTALCFLARQSMEVVRVHQLPRACVIEARIPSDMWSWAGSLVMTVTHEDERVKVEAASIIKGQKYDWGKSNRLLRELFADLDSARLA